jgi:uncharacterized protein (TIGR02246 family)
MQVIAAQTLDESFIRDILRVQTEAWNRGDGIAWAREFTDDCDFVNIGGGVLHGRSAVETRISATLQGRMKGSHLSLSIRQFKWLTPDIALVETDYEITGLIDGSLRVGATPDGVLNTRMTYVAVRRNKHWCFVAAQNTQVTPQP